VTIKTHLDFPKTGYPESGLMDDVIHGCP